MSKNTGRNTPCPCGSGKKFKHCCIKKAHNKNTLDFKKQLNVANLLITQGKYKNAFNILKKLLSISPDNTQALLALGITYRAAHNVDDAIRVFERLVALSPNNSNFKNDLALLYIDKKYFESALQHLNAATHIESNNSITHTNLALTYCNLGEIDLSISHYKKALKLDKSNEQAFKNLAFTLNYSCKHTPQEVFDIHLKYGTQYYAPPISNSHNNRQNTNQRIKIGYVSPDFRQHSVAYFIESVLKNHSKEYFEIYGYYNNDIDDEVTNRLKSYCDHWVNITNLSDKLAFKVINNNNIDILVDLSGLTVNNRMSLFAMKPAPIQVSWIGYPNTTGLKAIDYRITDSITDPIDNSDHLYTEKLIRLKNTFLSYTPNENTPDIKTTPAIKNNCITFGSFNNFSKTTPEVLHTWVCILKQTTNTRLFLKCGAFNEPLLIEKHYNFFEKAGINRDRIKLYGRNMTTYEHLDEYNNIDIALDPFPYNGTTTSFEALWMGTPFITLSGNSHASRVGASILNNLELSDLIAYSTEEYIQIAKKIAGNIDEISEYKNTLREKLQSSPLMDAISLTRNLENEYKRIYKHWQDNYLSSQ